MLSIAGARPASDLSNIAPDGSTNFDRLIEASAARRAFGLDGTGHNVAVIDTGVDYRIPALGGGIGAGHKVIAGKDFTGSPRGVLSASDHGTGVAGLIASDDPDHPGIAPGADIIALRVFNDQGHGSFARIQQALDWVVQNHSRYNITAVNLSISDGGNYASNQFALDGGVGEGITDAIGHLDRLNIPVVVAAGNSFDARTHARGMGFPAIVADSVSVSGSDSADQIAPDAQRLGPADGGPSATKIVAPSIGIDGLDSGNHLVQDSGTSFAAPQVTGSIVLLQQMYENAYHTLPTVDQLVHLLRQGSVTIQDGVTGADFNRLDVLRSGQILNDQIQAASAASRAGAPTGTTSVSTSSAPAVAAMMIMTGPTGPGGTATETSTGGGPATGTGTGNNSTATATPQALTEVIYNGTSLGQYPTSQLRALYPSLFAFLKGTARSIRIYGSQGDAPSLGQSQPTGKVAASFGSRPRGPVHATGIDPQHKAVPRPLHGVHKPAAAHKHSNFFSKLFSFHL